MQERFYKSINFGQSQWLIGDLSAQQGDVRVMHKKKDNIFIYKKIRTHNDNDFVLILTWQSNINKPRPLVKCTASAF